jgi:hypothetical protein
MNLKIVILILIILIIILIKVLFMNTRNNFQSYSQLETTITFLEQLTKSGGNFYVNGKPVINQNQPLSIIPDATAATVASLA